MSLPMKGSDRLKAALDLDIEHFSLESKVRSFGPGCKRVRENWRDRDVFFWYCCCCCRFSPLVRTKMLCRSCCCCCCCCHSAVIVVAAAKEAAAAAAAVAVLSISIRRVHCHCAHQCEVRDDVRDERWRNEGDDESLELGPNL
jgi:hypothetical protein